MDLDGALLTATPAFFHSRSVMAWACGGAVTRAVMTTARRELDMWNAIDFVLRTRRDQNRASPFRAVITLVIFGVTLVGAIRILFGPISEAINGI